MAVSPVEWSCVVNFRLAVSFMILIIDEVSPLCMFLPKVMLLYLFLMSPFGRLRDFLKMVAPKRKV